MSEITALMSVYNSEKYIAETIKTILNQSFDDFELLIVDDGSTDNTINIIKSFKDKRINLISLKDNVGVGEALKIGIGEINSKYVIKVDSDDLNYKHRFKLQKEFMDRREDVAVAKCLINYFYDETENIDISQLNYLRTIKQRIFNQVISSEDISKKINYCLCVHHSSIIIRTKVLKSVMYDSLRSGEDHILFYKINKLGYKFATLEEELVKIRVRRNSLTMTKGANLNFLEMFFELKVDEIIKFINGSQKIVIWGAGNLSKFILDKLKEINIIPTALVDGNLEKYEKSEFLGYDVFSKNILKENRYKVIIAAAPAIYSAQEFLNSINYNIDEDYYIFYA